MFIHNATLTWKSAPLQTDGNKVFLTLFEEVQQTQTFVQQEIIKNNRGIIYNFDLWETIMIWSDNTLKESFLDFIQQVSPINFTPEESVMLLYQSQDIIWKELSEYVDMHREALEQNIINNIVVANEGYMLLNQNKNIDSLFSLIAGKYLSANAAEENIRLLGYRMIFTTLSLAGKNGVLPQIFIYTEQQFIPLGYVNPELVYPILIDNPFLSKIYTNGIDGVFIFAATAVKTEYVDNNIDIIISTQEQAVTQNIFIVPIQRPKKIVAFDVVWFGNAFSKAYTQGVSYNQETQSLYIKILSRLKQEKISLSF